MTMVGQMLGVRFGPRSSQDSRVSHVWREVLGWYGPPCAQSLRSKDPARLFSLPTRFPAAPPPPPHCRHPPTTSSSLWACWGGRCGTRLPPFLEGSCHTLVTSCVLDCPLPSAATLGSGIPINPGRGHSAHSGVCAPCVWDRKAHRAPLGTPGSHVAGGQVLPGAGKSLGSCVGVFQRL